MKAKGQPYPKADNTVDAVVFSITKGALHVLLVRRGREKEPFFDHWALPGGFIDMEETLETALRRELLEETGLRLSYIEQLATFGAPGRDPRGRVISTAFLATAGDGTRVVGGDDAAEAKWFKVPAWSGGGARIHWATSSSCTECGGVSPWPEKFAFDHENILIRALERLRSRIFHAPLGASFLPQVFTLRELRQVYNVVLGLDQDAGEGSFRKRILAAGILERTGEQKKGSGRPAALYTFKEEVRVEGTRIVTQYGQQH